MVKQNQVGFFLVFLFGIILLISSIPGVLAPLANFETLPSDDINTDYLGFPIPGWEVFAFMKFQLALPFTPFGAGEYFNITQADFIFNVTATEPFPGLFTLLYNNTGTPWVETSSHATVYGMPMTATGDVIATGATGYQLINVRNIISDLPMEELLNGSMLLLNTTFALKGTDFRASNILSMPNELRLFVGDGDSFMPNLAQISSGEDGTNGNTPALNITVARDNDLPLVDFAPPTKANGTTWKIDSIPINVSYTEEWENTMIFVLSNSTAVLNITTITSDAFSKFDYNSGSVYLNFTSLPPDTYRYNVTLTDIISRQNTTFTREITLTDSACFYVQGSGHWYAGCGCDITEDVDLGGNNITINGTGTFHIASGVKITNWGFLHIEATCPTSQDGPGGFIA